MASDAWRTLALPVSMISLLSWALSKSFCEFAALGPVAVYGNGTVEVSWLT